MRIPIIKEFDNSAETETVELSSLLLPSHWYNFSNGKDKDKWTKTVVRLVRATYEYKTLIENLKTNKGMKFDSFFPKVNRDYYGKVNIGIEIHHEPFRLYDIVSVVLNKTLSEDNEPDMFDTVDEVMKLHYDGLVGLIPLSITTHEAVHTGKVFIPLQMIDEGYNLFVDKYSDVIEGMPALVDVMKAKLSLSKEYAKNPEKFISVLRKKYIYVINEGYSTIPDKII